MRTLTVAALLTGLVVAAHEAEASRFINSRFINSRFINSRFINSRFINTADLGAANGAASFYNPWTGETLPNVYLDRSTFVSSSWQCDSETQQCWQQEARGDAFVGTWTTATLNDGTPSWTYIAGRWQPPGAEPDTYLYWAYAWAESVDGDYEWLPVCTDANGEIEPAMPLAGSWDPTTGARTSYGGNTFTWACQSGAIGKCAMSGATNTMGYAPWEWSTYYQMSYAESEWGGWWYYSSVDGQRTHQACTRMVRADYCGDGTPHTETGNGIDVRDYFYNGRTEEMDGSGPTGEMWAAEALWNEDGAEWVSCQRLGAIGEVSCANHFILNNSEGANACFWTYDLPEPDALNAQLPDFPAYHIDPGEVLLGNRTANLQAQ